MRGELVDEEDPTARPNDAGQLGDHELGPSDVVERPRADGQVEARRLERKRGRIALDERDVADVPAEAPGFGEQLGRRVEPDDLTDDRRESERERSGSGSRVESALVPGELTEVAEAHGKLRDGALGLRRP